MIEVYKKFVIMISVTVLLLIMVYKSVKAETYKWVIIQSSQTQDNKVIMNLFPNSKMHVDGNIQYANYQNETQVREYLTSNGYSSEISDIVS